MISPFLPFFPKWYCTMYKFPQNISPASAIFPWVSKTAICNTAMNFQPGQTGIKQRNNNNNNKTKQWRIPYCNFESHTRDYKSLGWSIGLLFLTKWWSNLHYCPCLTYTICAVNKNPRVSWDMALKPGLHGSTSFEVASKFFDVMALPLYYASGL